MAYTTLKALFTAIAEAIRTKEESEDSIVAQDFPDRILSIQTSDHTLEDGIVTKTLKSYTNDRVDNVGSYVFYYSTVLDTVDVANVTLIHGHAFSNANLTKVNAPKCSAVGDGAFENCMFLSSCNMPIVSWIGVDAFLACNNLEHFEMHNGRNIDGVWEIGSIKNGAFVRTGIKSFVIRHLTDDIVELAGVDGDGYTPFGNSYIEYGLGFIYVPSALIEDYKTAENWSTYATQFRALEDYTVDGTVTGDLDESKI